MKGLNREILRLAIPSILANITIPLVGLVDTAIVGHISDASIIGGIAIGTMIFDLLYWNFGFLRVSTSGMTAQALGRGDYSRCAALIVRSLRIAMIGALLIWALQWFFVRLVIGLVPGSEAAEAFAYRYFYVRVWAAPATLSLMALKGWFIGLQDTVSPMLTDIVVNVTNMVVSYVLAVHTPVGAIGVAWGTIVAQYTGLILALCLVLIRAPKPVLREVFNARHQHLPKIDGLYSLNRDLFIRSLCFMVVYVGFTALASQYGDEELAVSSILMKLMMVFSFFVDGFAYAGEALVGKAIGEAQADGAGEAQADGAGEVRADGVGEASGQETTERHSLRRLVRILMAWALAVGGFFTLLYALWGDGCLRILTSETGVLERAGELMIWLVAMPIVSTIAFMWDGIYAGAAKGKPIRNAMIWAATAFVVGYVVSYNWAGVQAIYVAYFAHLVARVLYLSIKKELIYCPVR